MVENSPAPSETQMIAPRFTIRRMLVWTVVAAIVAGIARAATLQQIWAQAVIFGLLALVIAFALFALLYTLARATSSLFQRGVKRISGESQGESPFAEHRPPPKFVHAEDPAG